MNMSANSLIANIQGIRQNYDTTNPLIAEIIKAKEQQFRILQELNQQQEEEFSFLKLGQPENLKKKNRVTSVKKRRKPDTHFPQISLRRSTRIKNSPDVEYKESGEYKPEVIKSQIIRPPNDYGPMPGVEVGFHWETRMECSLYGVHRPTVAGIHGGSQGAYSIALSGGYPEDIDEGHSFIYTGAGGRDLKGSSTNPKNLRTAPQTKDQQLEGTNMSLVKSIESKLPIRVIRGYKSPSIFAPETGYRYDGLYQVVKYWEDLGKTGYRIYRFKMVRMKDQAPAPWENSDLRKRVLKLNYLHTQDEISNLEEDEVKENIRPFKKSEDEILYKTISDKEMKDMDNEIQTCINFFFKISPAGKIDEIKDKSVSEDFFGEINFKLVASKHKTPTMHSIKAAAFDKYSFK